MTSFRQTEATGATLSIERGRQLTNRRPVHLFPTPDLKSTPAHEPRKFFRAYARVKLISILGGFAVNFAVSQFIVFRPCVLLEEKQPSPRRLGMPDQRPTKTLMKTKRLDDDWGSQLENDNDVTYGLVA
jgi:hypothetical protein